MQSFGAIGISFVEDTLEERYSDGWKVPGTAADMHYSVKSNTPGKVLFNSVPKYSR